MLAICKWKPNVQSPACFATASGYTAPCMFWYQQAHDPKYTVTMFYQARYQQVDIKDTQAVACLVSASGSPDFTVTCTLSSFTPSIILDILRTKTYIAIERMGPKSALWRRLSPPLNAAWCPGVDPGFLDRGFICIKGWGSICWFYLMFLHFPMKMK